MTLRMNTALRNKRWDALFNSAAGIAFDGGTLEIRTGAQPATADAALTGGVLATEALPADAMAAASGGAIAKVGTWQDPAADATGTAGFFTIRDSTLTYRLDGTITALSGGGEMELDSINITAGQQVVVSTLVLTDPA